jgi:hypothetical protein
MAAVYATHVLARTDHAAVAVAHPLHDKLGTLDPPKVGEGIGVAARCYVVLVSPGLNFAACFFAASMRSARISWARRASSAPRALASASRRSISRSMAASRALM